MKRFKIALSDYIEDIQLCAQEQRIRTVLVRSGLPSDDIQEGLLLLFLYKGPRSVIESVLETEEQVRQLCELLGIEISSQDDKNILISKIIESSFDDLNLIGFSNIKKYMDTKMKSANLLEIARTCVTRIEYLMIDIYKIYIGDLLLEHTENKDPIMNTISKNRIYIREVLDQIAKYDDYIEKSLRFNDPDAINYKGKRENLEVNGALSRDEINSYLEFQNKIYKLNGQRFILGAENIEIINNIFEIRNEYVAHGNDYDQKSVSKNLDKLLDYIYKFLIYAIDNLPRVIMLINYTVNEFGFKYISYIDEDDTNIYGEIPETLIVEGEQQKTDKKIYLIESNEEFHPYQKVYCLYPNRLPIMRDPKLYYAFKLSK